MEHSGTPPGGSGGDKGRRMSRSDFDQKNLMKGVYGVGVHPSSPEKAGSVEDGSAEEEEVCGIQRSFFSRYIILVIHTYLVLKGEVCRRI